MDDVELQETYIERIRQGDGPITAARRVHATSRDIARYMEVDKGFAIRVEEARGEFTEALERVAHDKALDGDTQLLLASLKARRPADWMPPDKDLILKVQHELPTDHEISELHARLRAIETTSKELAPYEEP